MPKTTILEVEDAILAALEPLKAEAGVRQIAPYSGDLEPDKFAETVQSWPSLLIFYGGATIEDHGQRKIEVQRWVVFVCSQYGDDLALARRGVAGRPGAYGLLEAVREKLEDITVAAGLMPAKLLGQSSEVQGKGMAIYSAQFEISVPYLTGV